MLYSAQRRKKGILLRVEQFQMRKVKVGHCFHLGFQSNNLQSSQFLTNESCPVPPYGHEVHAFFREHHPRFGMAEILPVIVHPCSYSCAVLSCPLLTILFK